MNKPAEPYYIIEQGNVPMDVTRDEHMAKQKAKELSSRSRPTRIVATVRQQMEFDLTDAEPGPESDGVPNIVIEDEPTEPMLCSCYTRFCDDPDNFNDEETYGQG